MATGRLPDPNTAPVTAKGDLYTYSTVPAKLAVGNNGETLVADSSTTTGLRWQQPKAGNPILNSAYQIWQRGTSFSLAASSAVTYLADRWATFTGTNQACTISRQATGDTTNLPFIQYCLRYQRNSGQTGTGSLDTWQTFETVNSIPFAGQTVTFSFYARRGANFSASGNNLVVYLVGGTGTDQAYGPFTGQTTPINGPTATLTTTWQRFSFTGTVGSTVTQLAALISFIPTGTAGANDFYEITGVQLEVGSVATPFKTYAATLAGELAACQRYYYRTTVFEAYGPIGFGFATSSTLARVLMNTPTMRVKPTSIDYANVRCDDSSGINITLTSVAIGFASNNCVALSCNASSGFTGNRPVWLLSDGSTTSYVGLNSEL